MGGGDVKLLAMIGSFLGWKGAVITYFLAPFFGSLVSISINIYKFLHEYYTSHTVMGPKEICQRLFTGTIPYGPFLSLAALITLFFEKDIILFLYVFLGIRM
jgi:leader peptidase (prepilin peptidase)/N-methyltransferase